jgi:hypothetical protein
MHIAYRQIASIATVATAKEYLDDDTYKIKRFIWGVALKETPSPTAAMFVVLRRSIVDDRAKRLLRTLASIVIAKLETDKARKTRRIHLSFHLNQLLRGFATGILCIRSGEVSGGVIGRCGTLMERQ